MQKCREREKENAEGKWRKGEIDETRPAYGTSRTSQFAAKGELLVEEDDDDDVDDDQPPRGASGNTKVAKQTERPRRPEDGGRREFEARSVFMGIGVGTEQPTVSPPKTSFRPGPIRSDIRGVPGPDEMRRRAAEVRWKLR